VSVIPPADEVREAVHGRHRAVQDVVRWFHTGAHLPEPAATVSRLYAALVADLLHIVSVDDPELTRALSALLSSRDSAVRAALVDGEAAGRG